MAFRLLSGWADAPRVIRWGRRVSRRRLRVRNVWEETTVIQLLLVGSGRLTSAQAARLSRQFDVLAGAHRGEDALDLVANQSVHLLVTAEHLPDMCGACLAGRVKQWHPVQRPLLILLSSDGRHGEKGQAEFDAVVDGLQPVQAICEQIVEHARDGEARASLGTNFSGTFDDLDFSALVQVIGSQDKTGQLVLGNGLRWGSLLYREGALVHASFEGLDGREAFERLLGEMQASPAASFRFEPWSQKAAEGIRPTISCRLERLLLEAA